MKKILVYLLFLTGCVSNTNQVQDEDISVFESPYIISLEKEIEQISLTNLTEIGNTITYIPLETSDKSLLGDLKSIKVTDTHIVVDDRFSNALAFNHSGDFTTQIGRKGQGPGEYSLVIHDYGFSFDSKKIYLLVEDSKCLEYEINGKFLNSYKLDTASTAMLPLNDSMFVFRCQNSSNYRRPGSPYQSLIITDLNFNLKKAYPNYFKQNNKQMINISGLPFYSYQGNIRFKEYGVDTLYTVTEDELITYAIVSLGDKEFPSNLDVTIDEFLNVMKRFEGEKYFVKLIVEDNDNLFIALTDLVLYGIDNELYGYYNKRTNTVKVVGNKGFQNNIDGGLPFFPKYVYNDSILVSYVNAFTLREHVLSGNAPEMRKLYGQKYDDLVKLVNSLDDESNPVVVMVK